MGKTLEELRRAIDEIDEGLHDLLMRRSAVTDGMAAAKRAAGSASGSAAGSGQSARDPMRPAREVAILHRLAARHRDTSLPFETVVRVWREIVMGNLSKQGAFETVLYGGASAADYRDLARSVFGMAPLTVCDAPGVVIERVAKTPGAVGILPDPQDLTGEPSAWPALLAGFEEESRPRIAMRLPFVWQGGAPLTHPRAYLIGRVAMEPGGPGIGDTSLFWAEAPLPQTIAVAGTGPTRAQSLGSGTLIRISGFRTEAAGDITEPLFGPRPVKLVYLGSYADPVELPPCEAGVDGSPGQSLETP